jgi:hypothetical protein
MFKYTLPSASSANVHSSIPSNTLLDRVYVRPLSSEYQTWVEFINSTVY